MHLDRRLWVLGGTAAVLALVVGLVTLAGDGDDGVETSQRTSSTTAPSSTSRSSSTSTSTSTTRAPSTTAAPAPTTAAPAPTTTPPTTAGRDPFLDARIRLVRVTSVSYPIAMAVRPSDRSTWIATKGGSVCRLSGGSCTSAQQVADVSMGSEQGLLGIAFNSSGSRLYTSYTNPNGDSRVARHAMSGNSVGAGQVIFSQDQPYPNHNGGNIAFGPDGRLWLGLGDGGSGGDPQNRAQDPNTYLGKFVRLDPTSGAAQSVISGVRNPWRWSFDRATGALWIGDVGQNQWEEIDYLPAGRQIGVNLGWSRYEGTHLYDSSRSAPGAVFPVHEYHHSPGCSVTGGYVYRGSAVPALRGAYLFSDYCDGAIRGLKLSGGRVTAVRSLGANPGNVVSFGQDANGEIYVLVASGGVYRIVGA